MCFAATAAAAGKKLYNMLGIQNNPVSQTLFMAFQLLSYGITRTIEESIVYGEAITLIAPLSNIKIVITMRMYKLSTLS